MTALENEIPNISSLVKKTDYNTKLLKLRKQFTDHDNDKYITSPEFNNLAARAFTVIIIINYYLFIYS